MKKKGLLLRTEKQLNGGAIVSGVGFLLYLAAKALGWETTAGSVCCVVGLIAVWTFLSAAVVRKKDKETVSYNLLWGTGALALLLGACAVLTIRQRLGL